METNEIIDLFQVAGTILAAAIGGAALIKSGNSNLSDRISRAQWAFEMYISFLGMYLYGDRSVEDYKKYKAFFYLFYAYADKEIKNRLLIIDKVLNLPDDNKIQDELIDLIDLYYQKYNLARFGLKSTIDSKAMKGRIKTLYANHLEEKNFKQ